MSRARRIRARERIGKELSAKQMPLSDPRESGGDSLYPAMSGAPIGFQGKSDAAAASPDCSELVISLGWVKHGMTMRASRLLTQVGRVCATGI